MFNLKKYSEVYKNLDIYVFKSFDSFDTKKLSSWLLKKGLVLPNSEWAKEGVNLVVLGQTLPEKISLLQPSVFDILKSLRISAINKNSNIHIITNEFMKSVYNETDLSKSLDSHLVSCRAEIVTGLKNGLIKSAFGYGNLIISVS